MSKDNIQLEPLDVRCHCKWFIIDWCRSFVILYTLMTWVIYLHCSYFVTLYTLMTRVIYLQCFYFVTLYTLMRRVIYLHCSYFVILSTFVVHNSNIVITNVQFFGVTIWIRFLVWHESGNMVNNCEEKLQCKYDIPKLGI
jgi:hypothetical protein